jgi:3-oxoacyl-[acyl-carrier protein] reductase
MLPSLSSRRWRRQPPKTPEDSVATFPAASDVFSAFSLSGRTAVVTGGASGIGEATAYVLAAAGANVVAGDIDGEGAERTAKGIAEAGGTAVAQRVDVTKQAEVDALVDRGVSEFGRVDAVVNVAGIAMDGLIKDATEEQFDRVMAINAKGTLFGCQAALRVMTEQGSGSIINVSSTAVDTPAPKYGLYAMTKAAVAQLTMTLAIEAGRYGIRVNTIAPGATVTPFTARHAYNPDGTLNPEAYEMFVDAMRKISPLRLVGEAIDQAYLVLFLASDASRFCTGQMWRANGGQAIVR